MRARISGSFRFARRSMKIVFTDRQTAPKIGQPMIATKFLFGNHYLQLLFLTPFVASGFPAADSAFSFTAQAPAAAIASQPGPSRCKQVKPMNDASTCPPITLRGRENGASGKPKSNTQLAPKEPSTRAAAVCSATATGSSPA